MIRYDVTDEYGRLIETDISLRRALKTQVLNPGSQILKKTKKEKKPCIKN